MPAPRLTALIGLTLSLASARPAMTQDWRNLLPPESLEAHVRLDSLDPVARYELAISYLRRDRYNEAEAALRVAIRFDPRLAPAHLALAVVQDRNRDYWRNLRRQGGDSAVAREHRARREEARRAFLLDPLVDLSVLCFGNKDWYGMPDPDHWAGYEPMYRDIDFIRTIALSRVQTVDSLPSGLLWMHGVLSAHTGRFQSAVQDISALLKRLLRLERADSLHPIPLPTNEVRYLLAAIQQNAGNSDDAIQLYRQVIENDVGNYMADVQLARVYEESQAWSQAVAARRAAIAANPDDPTLQIDLGASLIGARFPERAESVLVEAGLTLHDPRLYYVLGRAQEAQHKREEARTSYETFLTMAPSRWAEAIADARRRVKQLNTTAVPPR